MKILLLYPYNFDPYDPEKSIIPGGLLSMGALLKKSGHLVALARIESKALEKPWPQIIGPIKPNVKNSGMLKKDEDFDLIGISFLTSNRFCAHKAADIARKRWPQTIIIAGGPHASALPTKLLENVKSLDGTVVGEGENAILKIVQSLKEKGELADFPGFYTRKSNSQITGHKAAEPVILDDIPIAAQHWTYNNVLTSRGCTGHCIFCCTPHFWGDKIRYRSSENIIYEINLLNQLHGLTYLSISDDSFLTDSSRAIKIAHGILENDIRVRLDIRFTPTEINDEMAKLLKRAGVVTASMGLESGDNKVLSSLGKKVDYDLLAKNTQILQKNGILVNFFVIAGGPGEDKDSFARTKALINKINPDFLTPAILHIFPGTPLEKTQQKSGLNIDWFDEKMPEAAPFYGLEHSPDELKNRYNQLAQWRPLNKKGISEISPRNSSKKKGPVLEKKHEESDPNHGKKSFDQFYEMGISFYQRGDLKKAKEALLNSFKLMPCPETAFELSQILLESEQQDLGAQYLEYAIYSWEIEEGMGLRQGKNSVLGHTMALAKMGHWQTAIKRGELALLMDGENPLLYPLLSFCHLRLGGNKQALSLLEQGFLKFGEGFREFIIDEGFEELLEIKKV